MAVSAFMCEGLILPSCANEDINFTIGWDKTYLVFASNHHIDPYSSQISDDLSIPESCIYYSGVRGRSLILNFADSTSDIQGFSLVPTDVDGHSIGDIDVDILYVDNTLRGGDDAITPEEYGKMFYFTHEEVLYQNHVYYVTERALLSQLDLSFDAINLTYLDTGDNYEIHYQSEMLKFQDSPRTSLNLVTPVYYIYDDLSPYIEYSGYTVLRGYLGPLGDVVEHPFTIEDYMPRGFDKGCIIIKVNVSTPLEGFLRIKMREGLIILRNLLTILHHHRSVIQEGLTSGSYDTLTSVAAVLTLCSESHLLYETFLTPLRLVAPNHEYIIRNLEMFFSWISTGDMYR